MNPIDEKCPVCGNMVRGTFVPSTTRKAISTLAKKGGMKVALGTAGSIIPGFGNVAGFVAGAAIDILCGDKINRFIDDFADDFEGDVQYKFECPCCSKVWIKTYSELDRCMMYFGHDSVSQESPGDSDNDDELTEFKKDFKDFLEVVDDLAESADRAMVIAKMAELREKGECIDNEVIKSQYFYLSGFLGMMFGKRHWISEDATIVLERAQLDSADAYKLLEDSEYLIVFHTITTLLAETVSEHENLGIIDYETLNFENNLFKGDFLKTIYEFCRFYTIRQTAQSRENDEILFDLWSMVSHLDNPLYKMYASMEMFWAYPDTDNSGEDEDDDMFSSEEEELLIKAYQRPGFSIDTCDVNDIFDAKWLEAYVEFASSIVDGSLPSYKQNVSLGISMLERATALGDCFAVYSACSYLAEFYEEGEFVSQDLEKALTYYKMAGYEPDIKRVTELINSESFSTKEQEYADEFQAYIEDGSEITPIARRLLTKLRDKLNISEERAKNIEYSLMLPKLTDAEVEYLDEYKGCLANAMKISSGERRLLNRFRDKLGITEARATEIERMA